MEMGSGLIVEKQTKLVTNRLVWSLFLAWAFKEFLQISSITPVHLLKGLTSYQHQHGPHEQVKKSIDDNYKSSHL